MYKKGFSFCLPFLVSFLFKFQCKKKQRTFQKETEKSTSLYKTDKHVQHTCSEGKIAKKY